MFRFAFSIRDVLWLMVVAGLGVAWSLERRTAMKLRAQDAQAYSALEARFADFKKKASTIGQYLDRLERMEIESKGGKVKD